MWYQYIQQQIHPNNEDPHKELKNPLFFIHFSSLSFQIISFHSNSLLHELIQIPKDFTYIIIKVFKINLQVITTKMSQSLTQQEINQRRREKILARSRKLQAQPTTEPLYPQQQQQPVSQPANQHNSEQQQAPFIPPALSNLHASQQQPPKPQDNNNQTQPKIDAFTRFKQLKSKAQRQVTFILNHIQKYLLIFAKFLGFIVAIIQLYLLTVLKKYHLKLSNNQITHQVFERLQAKFILQLSMLYWACFGTLAFSWVWIKFVRSARLNTEKVEIVPGSTIFSLLEQLNKFLEYKVLIKTVLGYTFCCVAVHLVLNQLITWGGYEHYFYKPDLSKILKPIIQSVQNEQIL